MFNRRIMIFGQVQPGNSHALLHNSGSLQPQQRALGALQKVWATWGEGNFSVSWCQNLDFHHPVLIPPLRSQRVLLSAPRSHYCPFSCHRFCYYVLPVTTAGIVSELLLLHHALLFNLCECPQGLPWWRSGEESASQCRRHRRWGFDPWVGKIPWRRKWQPSFLAWKIPWTEEPGGLQSMGLQRVGPTQPLSTHACDNVLFWLLLLWI